jgi:Predicted hydrolases or acyltransferases (alpha/beta hydrolase superfamily)
MQTQFLQAVQSLDRCANTLRWIFLLLALLLIGLTLTAAAHASKAKLYPAPGTLVSVGKHRLHLFCKGDGAPTVVMDAGLGGTSLDWVRVQPAVATYTRVCTYDRAGYGWSEPGPLPRTSSRIADELHTLLHQAGAQGPYILVGHSFGGYNVRLFASRYPKDTAGLVLVDSSHEDQYRRFRERLGVNTAPRGNFMLLTGPDVPENMPQEARKLAQLLGSMPSAYWTLRSELASLLSSADELRAAPPLPDVPLVVITRGRRVWPRTPSGNRMERLWMELQDDLATRTSQVVHLIADHSGHYIQLDEPEMVMNAIMVMVIANRP